MGCGSSTNTTDTIKKVPVEAPGEELVTPSAGVLGKQVKPQQSTVINNNLPSEKTVVAPSPGVKKEMLSSISNKKEAQKVPKNDSKVISSKTNGDNKSSTNLKRTQSNVKEEPSTTPKKELRQSSLGKSTNNLKTNNDLSKSTKNIDLRTSTSNLKEDLKKSEVKSNNPERQEGNKLIKTQSIIKEQELPQKKTVTKDSHKSIKKIKSVKNNKELTDLIKVYGL